MTCNQLMTLLAIYRGSSLDEIRCGTTTSDLSRLASSGLIVAVTDIRTGWDTTIKGDAVVREVLARATGLERRPETDDDRWISG